MSNTIREVVEQSLSHSGYSSYLHYAGPTIGALEQREAGIYNDLVAAGISLGANQADIEALLDQAGMTAPRPPHAVESNGGLSADERDELAAVRHDLSTLMER